MSSFEEETLLFIHTQHIYGAKLLFVQTLEHLRKLGKCTMSDSSLERSPYASSFYKVRKSILKQLKLLTNGIKDVKSFKYFKAVQQL